MGKKGGNMFFKYSEEQLKQIRTALSQITVSGENNVLALAYAMQMIGQGEVVPETEEE